MSIDREIAVVGAGFSGAIVAQKLAANGFKVTVFESRNHVAGNCHTERDSETGVLVHKYGPHIFHTDNQQVWDFVHQYDDFMPYVNRVKAISQGKVYSLPINLHTINQFFTKTLSPSEAKLFIRELSDKNIDEPVSFEEQALKFVGRELYEAFFKGYTLKQWGRSPQQLPASILKRLPVRFNYNDNYYNHKFQGMPAHGYTHIVEQILDHKGINVLLNQPFSKNQTSEFLHTVYTGPLDVYFEQSEGALAYRTLDFEEFKCEADYQGTAVINYCDEQVPWTRITEHKFFAPWEEHKQTVCFREFSRECTPDDVPYYPVRLLDDKNLLTKYIAKAEQEKNLSLVGRLGTYRYLDMDVAIKEALHSAQALCVCLENKAPVPSFFSSPV